MTEKRLTDAELKHLEYALGLVRRMGSYYGPYRQFILRQTRLERWANEQLEQRLK